MDSGRAGSCQSSRPADLHRSSRHKLSLCVPVSAAFAHALMSLQRPLSQLSQLALQLRPSALAWRPTPSLTRCAPRSRRIHLSPSLASRPSEAPTTTSNCAVPAISSIPLESALPPPPPPSSPITRYVCVVEYVGTNYHGWSPSAERDRACSVAGALESCIAPLARDRPVKVMGSGRTDRGVHALGQVFHVDLDRGWNRLGDGHAEVISPHRFQRAVNHHLITRGHGSIRVVHTAIVPESLHPLFHARHAATSRTYLYRLFVSGPHTPCSIFERDRCWHVRHKLDFHAMECALRELEGVHDFAAFQSSGCTSPTSVRYMSEARLAVEPHAWSDLHARHAPPPPPPEPDSARLRPEAGSPNEANRRRAAAGCMVSLHFSSRSFLYHQIRNMVGAVLSVGAGRMTLPQLRDALAVDSALAARGDTKEIERIRACKQRIGTAAAPAHGLFLQRIEYPWDIHDWSTRDIPTSPAWPEPPLATLMATVAALRKAPAVGS